MWHLLASLLLLYPAYSHAQNRYTDSDGLEWEDPVPEVPYPDNTPFEMVNVENENHFDRDQSDAQHEIAARTMAKKRVDQLLATSCDQIVAAKDKFQKEKISRTTRYFVPMFPPGSDGFLQSRDRRACINVEGSCVVEKYLYNWAGAGNPWGKRYNRQDVAFRFGKGSGASYYNATNALDPCRTVAADVSRYPVGSVIYIPAMRGKICPQNLKPVDGCFVVGDIGSAIQGQGRFDVFVGECQSYNKGTNDCADRSMNTFEVPRGSDFYLVKRHNMFAKGLREEADLLIKSDWISELFP